MNKKDKNIAIGESFSRLANMLLLLAGFMFVGAWTFYNIMQNKQEIPLVFNYLAWLSTGVFCVLLSLIIWLVSHNYIIWKLPKREYL